MPTPIATAGRDTSERADTAWQSIIRPRVPDGRWPVSMENRPLRQARLDVLPGALDLPGTVAACQHLPSMIDDSQRVDSG